MKPLIAFAIVSLLAGRMFAQASGGEVAESLRRNVVRIEAKFGDQPENGFGFIVGERGNNLYIVTANHVVSPLDPGEVAPKTVKVEFFEYQGQSFDATVLGTNDSARDLAVLTVPRPQPDFQWTKQCLGRAEQPPRATEVWFIGKSRQWYVPVNPGRVAGEDNTSGGMKLESMLIAPGSSGGPLLDSTGIVGIVLRDSADSSSALPIDAVKSFLNQYNHPFNLDHAAAAVPPVIQAATPLVPAALPATSPLREGFYELYMLNGRPQRGGILMHLRKVSDDYFLAETTTPTDYGWRGELHRSGDAWDLKIPELRGPRRAAEGTALNPGNGRNEISKEGPLVTFKSELGTFVWQETQKTSVERAPARTEAQPPSPSIGNSVISALMGTLTAPRTRDECVSGYVWREARPDDHVCVTPDTRRRTATENYSAAAHRNSNGGAYGAETCLEGYVWRDAFAGDHTCVSPQSRLQAAADNNQARARVAH